jgi:hypothetical protein
MYLRQSQSKYSLVPHVTIRPMWAPDRTQWWLIWIGFLACSLVAADDAVGLAAFLFGIFGLLIYYRETLRRARAKEVLDAQPAVDDEKPDKRWEDMTPMERMDAEIYFEGKHEDWKRKNKR